MAPKVDKRTKEGKAKWEEYLIEIENVEKSGKIQIDEKDFEDIEKMLDAGLANPEVDCLIRDKEVSNEETIVWQDEETGVWLKARPDARFEANEILPENTFLDYKTIKPFTRKKELFWEIVQRHYHVQAAMVIDGYRAVTGKDSGPFVDVFFEKGSEYKVCLVPIPDSLVEQGRDIYKQVCREIQKAQESKIWTGFVDIESFVEVA